MQHQDFRVDLIFRFLHEYRSHIYSHILCICISKRNTHTRKHKISLHPGNLQTYTKKKTQFITSPGRSLVDKVITFWNDFCLSYFENRQLLLMLDSLLPTAPNCLHEKNAHCFNLPETFAIRCIHLFIYRKEEEKKSSPHPHRTAIPICSSVPLVRARMLFKGTSTGRCETCFYLKFCDLFCLALLSCANYNQA